MIETYDVCFRLYNLCAVRRFYRNLKFRKMKNIAIERDKDKAEIQENLELLEG